MGLSDGGSEAEAIAAAEEEREVVNGGGRGSGGSKSQSIASKLGSPPKSPTRSSRSCSWQWEAGVRGE